MKEKLLILFAVLLISITGTIVVAQEFTITSADQFYKYAYVTVEKYRISMEALISYTDEIEKDSSILSSTKEEFVTTYNTDLKEAVDTQDWEKIESVKTDMKDTITNFRQEAKIQLTGQGKVAMERLNSALVENKGYLASLLKEARGLHRDRNMEVFDYRIVKAKEVIEKLESYEIETSEVVVKLSEIETERSNFLNSMNEAIDVCDGIYEIGCGFGITGESAITEDCLSKVDSYCTLKDKIIEEFKELQDLVYEVAELE